MKFIRICMVVCDEEVTEASQEKTRFVVLNSN